MNDDIIVVNGVTYVKDKYDNDSRYREEADSHINWLLASLEGLVEDARQLHEDYSLDNLKLSTFEAEGYTRGTLTALRQAMHCIESFAETVKNEHLLQQIKNIEDNIK